MENSIKIIANFHNDGSSLTTDRINVFLINFDLFISDDFMEFLSNNEINRVNKIKSNKKKQQFIITRGITKKILSNILEKKHNQIEILYNQHGKPFINEKYNNHSVEFNASHSGKYGLIGVTLDNKIGVDIQKIKSDVDIEGLSSRFFSNNERDELMKLAKNKQSDAFYLGWVRKESFIKATGIGVAYGLDRFSVPLCKNEDSDMMISDFENKQWHCYDLLELENYKTALTTSKSNMEIQIS